MFKKKKNKFDDLENSDLIMQPRKGFNADVRSDFTILAKVFFEFLVYFVFLIPNLILLVFYVILADKVRANRKFEEISVQPFKILGQLYEWFFEAKVTAWLILILCFIFFLEFSVLSPYMNNLMVHTSHLFTGSNFYSTLTSVFLHADIWHLLTNCLALLIFGRQVEKDLRFNVLWVFLASGIIANVISNFIAYVVLGQEFYSLGASGAIAGLIIFAILLHPLSFTTILVVPLPIFLVGWLIIYLDIVGLAYESTTNHLAHLGGYLALLFLFFFLELKNRKKVITGFSINLAMILLFYVVNKIWVIV